MIHKNIHFGEYIKKKRITNYHTLFETSKKLKIPVNFLCDIENGRREPFDEEKIEIFSEYLGLSEYEKAELYNIYYN
jgi:cytoskeletal protein RodZ